MREELTKKLCQTYPKLYSKDFGFACGDGWYHLLDVASLLVSRHSPGITANQIKEKFGGLRYYYSGSGHGEYLSGVISMTEQLSGITCDQCGAPGNQYCSNGGYVCTSCSACAKKAGMEPFPVVEDEEDSHVVLVKDLGEGWSRLVNKLAYLVDFYAGHGKIPDSNITTTKHNGVLIVNLAGGNDFARGLVDFINFYAARIDEHTGKILTRNKINQ